MSDVQCRPDDAQVPTADESVLSALLRAGIPITHACGGNARCSTCRVRVEAGMENTQVRTDDERAMADKLQFDDETRLACQLRIDGDVTVRRLILDDHDLRLVSTDPTAGAAGRDERVAILFADVADFTPLSESLPAYDVIHLLNRYFFHVGRVIEEAGGQIDNYMGDGLMAVFRGDEASKNAVRAGLAMLAEVENVDAYTQPLYGHPFKIRVGIHAGRVVIGPLGACHKRTETVIGDAVNVASRIEGANKGAGTQLLVSQSVLDEVGDAVTTGKTVDAALKGKSGTHQLTEILGID